MRKNIEKFVEYVEGEPLMVKNMIGAYGNTDIALHGGAMLRECIRYENLARMTLYDETLWLFFDQVGVPWTPFCGWSGRRFKFLRKGFRSCVAAALHVTVGRSLLTVGFVCVFVVVVACCHCC